MPRRRPRDPMAADARAFVAQRRAAGRACQTCRFIRPTDPIERRPEALYLDQSPLLCAECRRIASGHSALDNNHVAGRRNSDVTVPTPANDHRAILSVDQYDWNEALRNAEGSPLLAGAAALYGTADTYNYLIEKHIDPSAQMLEALDAYLRKKLGERWWEDADLGDWKPPWPK